ncbi:MAG: NTP transferase domain-containing protein [Marmoricola sp.]
MSSTGPGAGGAFGVVLAAGAGRRMGQPKALVTDGRGSWLLRAVAVLEAGGCSGVGVVLGAGAEQARRVLAAHPHIVVGTATRWRSGLSASLAAALDLAAAHEADALVVTLVDLPDLPAGAVRRLLAAVGADPGAAGRASYQGRPGHPVVLGRSHWTPLRAGLRDDSGARDYLSQVAHVVVECGDLGSGEDADTVEGLLPLLE